jgi:hypothetical protein
VDVRIKVKIINAIVIPTATYILPFVDNKESIMKWDILIKKYIKIAMRISTRSAFAQLKKVLKLGGMGFKSLQKIQKETVLEELFNIHKWFPSCLRMNSTLIAKKECCINPLLSGSNKL